MKFGAHVTVFRTNYVGFSPGSFTPTWDDIHTSIETVEAGRWNSLWVSDHFLSPFNLPNNEENPWTFEAWTVLAVAAGMTQRVKLGHVVLGNTYRNPALVAKMATTLDQASKGRFILGIGAAWFKREHEAYGWDFPSMKQRSDRFQEACELIRKLFTADGPVDYDGRYYQLDQAQLSPGCYQEPHVPIMVGGTGERRTLRTLAMYGDMLNINGFGDGVLTLESYQHKVDVLERHCEEVGRDPAEIKRTIHAPLNVTDDNAEADRFVKRFGPGHLAGPRDYIISRIGEFADAGVDEIMCAGFRTGDVETLQRVDEEIVAAFC